MSARGVARGLAVALVVVSATGACGGIGHDRGPTDLNDPVVLRWGVGPDPNSSVTLQPDVVVIEGGGRAIRSSEQGGLVWHLDANAGNADRLEVGKVMFVTNRSVGRILHLERKGDDLMVIVGPVTLVDLVKDGTLQATDVSLDAVHENPPLDLDVDEPGGAVEVEPAVFWSRHRAAILPGAVPRPLGTGTPFGGKDGAGVQFWFNQDGTKFEGRVGMRFTAPKVNFFIQIRGGTLVRAEVTITGGFGTFLDFTAGTETGVNQTIDIPAGDGWSIQLPIDIGPFPVMMTIRQSLVLKTGFGTKIGTFGTRADYDLGSTIGFRYSGGSFEAIAENSFTPKVDMLSTMHTASPGVMAALVKHVVHLSIGVKTGVLDAGPYIDLETTFGATAGSGIGAVALAGSHFVQCRGAAFQISANVGLGFRILDTLAQLINKFLALFHLAPIPNRIGPPAFRQQIVALQDVSPPDTALCGEPGAFGGVVQDDPQRHRTSASFNGEDDPVPPKPVKKPKRRCEIGESCQL